MADTATKRPTALVIKEPVFDALTRALAAFAVLMLLVGLIFLLGTHAPFANVTAGVEGVLVSLGLVLLICYRIMILKRLDPTVDLRDHAVATYVPSTPGAEEALEELPVDALPRLQQEAMEEEENSARRAGGATSVKFTQGE